MIVTNKTDTLKGCIFHIIHGSFVDGFGVRTTIFLKGCPLRCLWCCNPEGQERQLEIKLTTSKCNDCGNCVEICPKKAITLNKKPGEPKVVINRKLCDNCGKCMDVCYTGAIEYFGKMMTVDEVFDIVKKDENYYRMSGGGVSIGGGEPTFQSEFTYALLRKCKDNYIHVAIDTCGYTTDALGIKILEEADLLLWDIKGMEAEGHLINTGVSNSRILDNLKHVSDLGVPVIIRMPILPHYNDSMQNIKDTAEFLSKLKSIVRVDILPYHKFGIVKYEQLEKKYELGNLDTPPQEHIDEIISIFERHGLKAQIGG